MKTLFDSVEDSCGYVHVAFQCLVKLLASYWNNSSAICSASSALILLIFEGQQAPVVSFYKVLQAREPPSVFSFRRFVFLL